MSHQRVRHDKPSPVAADRSPDGPSGPQVPVAPFAIRTGRATAGQVLVVVAGQIDYDCAAEFERRVTAVVCERPGPIEFDLTGVSFCDCAGLNVLLRTWANAVASGRGLRIRTASRQIARLLDLTDTAELLGAPPAPAAQPHRTQPEPPT